MSSFTKLDSGIVDSTLWMQPHDVLRVWIAMLAKTDATGYVRASVPAMAHLCMVPIDRMEQILEVLASPDPYSRTQDDEGRRLLAVEGGWQIVNYLAYRNARDEEARREQNREAKRRQRDRGKAESGQQESAHVSNGQQCQQPSAQAEAEADKELESAVADLSAASASPPPTNPESDDDNDGEQPRPPQGEQGRPPCPHERIVALYHEVLPELRRVREWNETRRRLLGRRWSERPERQDLSWWREFFGYVRQSRFLMGQTTGRDSRAFDCDLEWLVRPTNFAKVIEGKYEDAAT